MLNDELQIWGQVCDRLDEIYGDAVEVQERMDDLELAGEVVEAEQLAAGQARRLHEKLELVQRQLEELMEGEPA